MLEFLQLVSSKPVVVGLAVIGAVMVTAGSFSGISRTLGKGGIRLIVVLGYGITGTSVLLFIISGFLVH